MSLNNRFYLIACVFLITPAAFAQPPAVVTTLPRPIQPTQFPTDTPPPQNAVPLIPNGSFPALPPVPGTTAPNQQPENLVPVPNSNNQPPTAPMPLGPPLTGPAPPGPPPIPLYGPGPDGPPPPGPVFPDELSFMNRRIRFDILEVDMLFPHVDESLNQMLNVGGLYTTTAYLPMAHLGFTTPFAAELAYILPKFGEIGVAYRLLSTEGDGVLQNFDPAGPAAIRSRLDANIIDIGVSSTGYGPWRDLLWRFHQGDGRPNWTLNWDLQSRIATVYFDSEAIGPTLDRHIVNYFYGAGPRGGLTLTRWFPGSNISVFERVDAGVVFGESRQQFSELASDIFGNPLGFGYAARSKGEAVPVLTLQFGVQGRTIWFQPGTWEIAYQFEQWWGIGNFSGGTTANLTTSGLILKWTFRY